MCGAEILFEQKILGQRFCDVGLWGLWQVSCAADPVLMVNILAGNCLIRNLMAVPLVWLTTALIVFDLREIRDRNSALVRQISGSVC